jgi:AmiR/NasT family two-component response regulator
VSQGPDSRYNREMHQAAGIVSIQADCELEQAYVLMSERAAVAHRSLGDIAQSVVDHSIRFGRYAN